MAGEYFDFGAQDVYNPDDPMDLSQYMPSQQSQSFDWAGSMPGYESWFPDQSQQQSGADYSGMSDVVRSGGSEPYQPSINPMSPDASISSAPKMGPPEEDWLDKLKKAGMGMGVGLVSQGLGGLLQNAMAPKAQGLPKQQMPQMATPPGAVYKPEPLAPLPGTQASPLLKGRPTQTKISQGLEEKRPGYGGFSMY